MEVNHGCIRTNVVQIPDRRIFSAEITWRDGLITALIERGDPIPDQPYLLPGFIDAHVHIESSMLTPAEFARIACRMAP